MGGLISPRITENPYELSLKNIGTKMGAVEQAVCVINDLDEF